MEKYYRFAGVDITVSIRDEWMYADDGLLAPFRVESVMSPHYLQLELVDELSSPVGNCVASLKDHLIYWEKDNRSVYLFPENGKWNNASVRIWHNEKWHIAQVKTKAKWIDVKTVLNALSGEHLIARNNGFVFHCSYIDAGGKAILFTAPSETGKSTQADLWAKHRGAEIINGDRAAIRLVGDTLMAEGIPFAGSSQYCKNRSLPIEAIVYLGKAPVTTIRKLRGYEAFSKIWEGVSVNTWDPEDMDLVSGIVQKVAEQIPIYHMPCTPDEAAVIALEETLRKQGSL